MDSLVRILLVEDDEDDYILTRDLLADGFRGRFELDWASSAPDGLERLLSGEYSVALFDYHLGSTTGLELLRTAVARGCHTPIIMLTGQDDRATDLQAMHAGAADYLLKGHVTPEMLERAIRYALERQRLLEQIRSLSLTDELTGLNNRRAFLTMAEQRLQMLERSRSLCLLLFADVDGLKRTNDTIGHDAGDQLIIQAARVLRAAFRRSDLVARLGGDEFVVFAEISDEEDALLLLEKLQHQIEASNAAKPAGDPPLSISAGYFCFRTGPTVRLPELVAEADLRMRECKAVRGGRDRALAS